MTPPHDGPRNKSEFEFMPANGSISITLKVLDIRTAVKFCGDTPTPFSVRATFHVAEAGGTTIVGSIPYYSSWEIIYPSLLPALPDAFEERAYKCSPEYLHLVKEGILGCASLATAAREAALTGSAERMQAYFNDSSQTVRDVVAHIFADIADQCSLSNSRMYFTCNHRFCNLGANGYVLGILWHSDPAHLIFCKHGYFLPLLPDSTELLSIVHAFIHEMSHLPWLKWPTVDVQYGIIYSTALPTSQSVRNADSYALFADAVYLHEDGLNRTRAEAMKARGGHAQEYDYRKYGNITRSEFLTLSHEARLERFGFHV